MGSPDISGPPHDGAEAMQFGRPREACGPGGPPSPPPATTAVNPENQLWVGMLKGLSLKKKLLVAVISFYFVFLIIKHTQRRTDHRGHFYVHSSAAAGTLTVVRPSSLSPPELFPSRRTRLCPRPTRAPRPSPNPAVPLSASLPLATAGPSSAACPSVTGLAHAA